MMLFIFSFIAVVIGAFISYRLAIWGIPIFGFGWLFAIAWWGLLR
jgi:hypothetical protein